MLGTSAFSPRMEFSEPERTLTLLAAGTGLRISECHESVLHSFSGGNDGLYPLASLIQDAAGNLYGTTSGLSSFTSASGTVFKLDAAGNETVPPRRS
jgi:hypothetical protein